MSRRIILVSPPGQRLTLRADGTLNAETSPDEGYSTIIVQGPVAETEPEKAKATPEPGPPPPPPDITMTFVAGLPPGLEPQRLARATVVQGPVHIAELHARLDEPSKGLADIVVLKAGNG